MNFETLREILMQSLEDSNEKAECNEPEEKVNLKSLKGKILALDITTRVTQDLPSSSVSAAMSDIINLIVKEARELEDVEEPKQLVLYIDDLPVKKLGRRYKVLMKLRSKICVLIDFREQTAKEKEAMDIQLQKDRESILQKIRANKKYFREALNSLHPVKWDMFKVKAKMTEEEMNILGRVLKEGIEYESWMDSSHEESEPEESRDAVPDVMRVNPKPLPSDVHKVVDTIKRMGNEFHHYLSIVPIPNTGEHKDFRFREIGVALQKVEEAIMWAVKGVTK